MDSNKIVYHLLDKQGEINGLEAGYYNEPDFWNTYTTTPEKEVELRVYAIDYIRKKTRYSKKWAENQVSWIMLMWGLRTIYREGDNLSPSSKTNKV